MARRKRIERPTQDVRAELLERFRARPPRPVACDPPTDVRAVPSVTRNAIAALEAGQPVVVYRWQLPAWCTTPFYRATVGTDGELSPAPAPTDGAS